MTSPAEEQAGPSRPLYIPTATPAVPQVYPNLQTATQVRRLAH